MVAGNWKMNTSSPVALELIEEIKKKTYSEDVTLIVIPPILFLPMSIK